MRTSGKPSLAAPRNSVSLNSNSSSGVISRSRRRPISRLPAKELPSNPRRSVAAAGHIEARADRARVDPVTVERVAPRAHELVGHDRVPRQHLRSDDLDARSDTELGHAIEQALEVVPAGRD